MAAYVALTDRDNPVIIDRQMVCHIPDTDKENTNAINKLIDLYNKAAITWPQIYRSEVYESLKNGEFTISDRSAASDPKEHPLYKETHRDGRFRNGMGGFPETQFSDWFIMAGIYGVNHDALLPMRKWIEGQQGSTLRADFRNHGHAFMPITNTHRNNGGGLQGTSIEKMVYRLIEDCTELKATIKNLQEQNEKLQQRIEDLEKTQLQQKASQDSVDDTLEAICLAIRRVRG